jgi:hypothetical protein
MRQMLDDLRSAVRFHHLDNAEGKEPKEHQKRENGNNRPAKTLKEED